MPKLRYLPLAGVLLAAACHAAPAPQVASLATAVPSEPASVSPSAAARPQLRLDTSDAEAARLWTAYDDCLVAHGVKVLVTTPTGRRIDQSPASGPSTPTTRPSPTRRPRTPACWRRSVRKISALSFVALLVVIGVILVVQYKPAPLTTASVRRTDLTDAKLMPGTLGFGTPHVVKGAGPGVLTKLPAVGAVVARGVTIYRVDDEPVTVLYGSTPIRLRQAVGNLVTNAIRHTPAGGQVTLSSRTVNSALTIDIADTGPGIPADHLPMVFERFWRAEKSRSRRTGGSGLGLSIVRKLAEAHNGTVSVTSEEGKGATFTLRIPITD